jgi:hypothetical protein
MNRIKIAFGIAALGLGAIGSSFTNQKPGGTGWFNPAADNNGVGKISRTADKTAANYPNYYGATAPILLGIVSPGNCSANVGNVCAAEFTITSGGGAGAYQNQYVTGQFNY